MCNGPVQQTPGYQATLQQPGQGAGQFSGTRPWTSVPFMQTYGGQQAPWADLSTQTLAAWNGTQNGAGRFNGNAAARYGFAGPWQQQQDTRQASSGFNTGGGDPYAGGPNAGNMRYNPMPVSGPPGGGEGQYGGKVPTPGGPPNVKPMSGGTDPMAGFQSLLQQDPRAAAEALNFNPGWFQKNQAAVGAMVPGGDLGAWRNSLQPQASNVGAITEDQRALIRQKMGW